MEQHEISINAALQALLVLHHADTRALKAVAGVVLSAPLLPIPPQVC